MRSGPELRRGALAWRVLLVPVVAGALLWHARVESCGDNYPAGLSGKTGDYEEGVLRAPRARFERELALLAGEHGARRGSVLEEPPVEQRAAELRELDAALVSAGTNPADRARIAGAWRTARARSDVVERGGKYVPPPFPAGLTGEFGDYLRGAIAWNSPGGHVAARPAWEALLSRPAAERRQRSTWAAFMLGRSWAGTNWPKAAQYFQRVRTLAAEGCADRLHLARDSRGEEARAEYAQQHFGRAIALYLEQYAGGDRSAPASLTVVSQLALGSDPAKVRALARDPLARRVLAAYLLAGSTRVDDEFLEYMGVPARTAPAPKAQSADTANGEDVFLVAIEAADVHDPALAERMALVAYQRNDLPRTRRWLARAGSRPAARWLRAKLLLHDGRLPEATALLARLVHELPAVDDTFAPATATLASSIDEGRERAQGVLGMARLAAGQYEQALDLLLRAGYWQDAAYVGERVLTLDEFKAYVDAHWSAAPALALSAADARRNVVTLEARELTAGRIWHWNDGQRALHIRYLLARRLARAGRTAEARAYYPEEYRPRFEQLERALAGGADAQRGAEARGRDLFAAASLTRHWGMELLGTEGEPDWHWSLGAFDDSALCANRVDRSGKDPLRARADERRRAARAGAEPEQRFHYRYRAAALAWQAAQLLPDGSPLTAHVLRTGGAWLKAWAPDSARRFYVALVRRCGETPLGMSARRMHWFPSDAWHEDAVAATELVVPAATAADSAGLDAVGEGSLPAHLDPDGTVWLREPDGGRGRELLRLPDSLLADWRSAPAFRLEGVYDLDGDGRPEVYVQYWLPDYREWPPGEPHHDDGWDEPWDAVVKVVELRDTGRGYAPARTLFARSGGFAPGTWFYRDGAQRRALFRVHASEGEGASYYQLAPGSSRWQASEATQTEDAPAVAPIVLAAGEGRPCELAIPGPWRIVRWRASGGDVLWPRGEDKVACQDLRAFDAGGRTALVALVTTESSGADAQADDSCPFALDVFERREGEWRKVASACLPTGDERGDLGLAHARTDGAGTRISVTFGQGLRVDYEYRAGRLTRMRH